MPRKKKSITQDTQKPVIPTSQKSSSDPDELPTTLPALPPPKPDREPIFNEGNFPIVGIGASAGGLEALESFFSKMPSDSHIAFVIIQHLSPTHKSIMGALLQKYTNMRVVEIQDGMTVEPNSIYLNPPDKHVNIIGRTLYLIKPVKVQGVNLPIDDFLRTLSDDRRERAICIILSGTGADGTSGLRAIKGNGGMAMVQAEQQAKYDGMPRSAIDTGLVDYVLPVEQMPSELLRYIQHPYVRAPEVVQHSERQVQQALRKIYLLIRSQTGHDFSNYKQTTIRRRVERRMAVHQIETFPDYIRYLQHTPAEIDTLFKDMLIGVTNFFRDPEVFESLQKQACADLVQQKPPGGSLRVWVPGCATGEEAYSLAMLLVETLERVKKLIPIQIFATDLDSEAIDHARTGMYPDNITADVSETRLRRFFVREGANYKIKKEIRELVVFAPQNLIKDPPFSRLDLVSCRNVLIYMNTDLQKKLIPLFHYTLLPQGILLLGTSESIGEFTDHFRTIDTKHKIYARKDAISEIIIPAPDRPVASNPITFEMPSPKRIVNPLEIRHRVEKNHAGKIYVTGPARQ